tara:strand:+ start:1128 stop:1367 length:240 start_codon:yes stop_codon:yes gene_type:complete
MPKCDKVTFNDKEFAKERCKQIKSRSGNSLKVYFCHKCGDYHLTSQTESVQKETKKKIAKNKVSRQLDKEDYYNDIYGI